MSKTIIIFKVKRVRRIFLLFIVMVLFLSCRTKTVLETSDPDAEIIVKGQKKSEDGSLTIYDRTPFWGSTEIEVRKKGCRSQYYRISKTDEFSADGFMLGFLTYGIGFLWTTTYLPEYELHYTCISEGELKKAGHL